MFTIAQMLVQNGIDPVESKNPGITRPIVARLKAEGFVQRWHKGKDDPHPRRYWGKPEEFKTKAEASGLKIPD